MYVCSGGGGCGDVIVKGRRGCNKAGKSIEKT